MFSWSFTSLLSLHGIASPRWAKIRVCYAWNTHTFSSFLFCFQYKLLNMREGEINIMSKIISILPSEVSFGP